MYEIKYLELGQKKILEVNSKELIEFYQNPKHKERTVISVRRI